MGSANVACGMGHNGLVVHSIGQRKQPTDAYDGDYDNNIDSDCNIESQFNMLPENELCWPH